MGLLDHHAADSTRQPVECDVVLPFHGHLPYVREALTSILEQDSAEAIVHLIDDATPGGTDELLRYWGSDPRVRTYRNTRNIGQFQSFNNVFPYFETAWLPSRTLMISAGPTASTTRETYCGSPMRTFSAAGARSSGTCQPRGAGAAIRPHAASPYSHRASIPTMGAGFFLENPTAMFRVAAFEALRGFGDYGDLDCNKCGLDTSFMHVPFQRHRFAISRRVVVNYRVHGDSAVRTAGPASVPKRGCGPRPRIIGDSTCFSEVRSTPASWGPCTPRPGLPSVLGTGTGELHHER